MISKVLPAHLLTVQSTENAVELTIVMPCLNEAETLATCIRKAQSFLDMHNVVGEVLIGDNGSTDGSPEIAEQLGARVAHVPFRGYGAALYYATLAARGKYIIMGDSDDSYDFTDLMPFVEKLREGYDLVMGNRFKGGIKPGAMPWKNRHIGNPVLTTIGRIFFKCPSGDFHCGLRGFSAEAFSRMDLRTTGMEYASEMVIKATLLGLKIAEVPTTLSPDGRSRPPHLRPWRDGWRHLIFMLLYSPRWLFLYPGIVLLFAGLITGAIIWVGPLKLGGAVLDVHTLLYSSVAVLLGCQAIAFAVFTKMFAIREGLLPVDPRLTRLTTHLTVEIWLIVGVLMLTMGLAGSIAAVFSWKDQDFGGLDPRQMLRLVIPSILALLLGAQIVLNSFFYGVLQMGMRIAPTTPTVSEKKSTTLVRPSVIESSND